MKVAFDLSNVVPLMKLRVIDGTVNARFLRKTVVYFQIVPRITKSIVMEHVKSVVNIKS